MKKLRVIVLILIGVVLLYIVGLFIGESFLMPNRRKSEQNKGQITSLKTDNNMKTNVSTDNLVKTNNTESKGTVTNNDGTNTSTNIEQVQSNENEEKSSNTQNGEEGKVSVITSMPTQGFSDNSVIITNKSGKEVPENILGDAMRQWILKWQYSYSGFADYKNTVWGEPWLDTISNETLASTFVEANGQDSPYYNVTASELNSATVQLTENQLKKPWPLTYDQASDYIHNEFKKQFINETITKIVQNSYGYDVYSNPYNEKNKYPIIVIEGATGYQSN